jgi:hypothetical protein
MELAMVFDGRGRVLHWHEPPGCLTSWIPDTRSLWEVLIENVEILGGVAHIHPSKGMPSPSHEDITTFRANEDGLGRKLIWPIASLTHVGYFWRYPEADHYVDLKSPNMVQNPWWAENIEELRHRFVQRLGGGSHDGYATA